MIEGDSNRPQRDTQSTWRNRVVSVVVGLALLALLISRFLWPLTTWREDLVLIAFIAAGFLAIKVWPK